MFLTPISTLLNTDLSVVIIFFFISYAVRLPSFFRLTSALFPLLLSPKQ
ncbi:hypothetical protein HMPREF1368_03226 [Enterococcus faecium ERV69]|nr:hypothetical protein HMPREF1368_03226 [Enterococcus faecium ERV69]